jgi:hypothetical protein
MHHESTHTNTTEMDKDRQHNPEMNERILATKDGQLTLVCLCLALNMVAVDQAVD